MTHPPSTLAAPAVEQEKIMNLSMEITQYNPLRSDIEALQSEIIEV